MSLPHLCNMLALLSVGLVTMLFIDEPMSVEAIALVACCISAAHYDFVTSVRLHIANQPPSLYQRQRRLHLQAATATFAWSQAALAAYVLHALVTDAALSGVLPSLVALIALGECFAAWFHWAAFNFTRPPRIPQMPALA